MIAQGRAHHKLLAALLGLTLVLMGCGGDGSDDTSDQAAAPKALACPMDVDTSGWQAFLDLAGHIESGATVERAELEALASQPAYLHWRASFPVGSDPNGIRMANWLERTFAEELGVAPKRKVNIELRNFSRSFRWSLEQRAAIDQRLGQLAAGPWCELDQRLRRWIPAARMPDTTRIVILPGRPELRFFDGRIHLDSGVIAAGTNQQLLGQIAGLAYRNLAAIEGPNPLEIEGEKSIAHLFRIVTNEGIATWLEDLPNTSFLPQHPTLHRVQPVPEDYWNLAIRVLSSLDRHLPGVLDDPDAQPALTKEIVYGAAGGGLPGQGGWCMAVTIAEVLGEGRLHAVAHSVPAFMIAYQEATAGTTSPPPALVDVPGAYHRAMPHLSPATWDRLLPLLEKHFPAEGGPGT